MMRSLQITPCRFDLQAMSWNILEDDDLFMYMTIGYTSEDKMIPSVMQDMVHVTRTVSSIQYPLYVHHYVVTSVCCRTI